METTWLIALGIPILLVILWYVVTYNKFIAKSNRIEQAESSIDVMLKQRNDMIPNLVAAAQNYMGQENNTLIKIAELRSAMQKTENKQESIQLGAELSQKLADIKIAVESYPELKSDRHFLRLEESIEEMEYNLQAARRTYNAAVVDYNNSVQMFPSNIIASSKKYQPQKLIRIPEKEKENVDVNALLKR